MRILRRQIPKKLIINIPIEKSIRKQPEMHVYQNCTTVALPIRRANSCGSLIKIGSAPGVARRLVLAVSRRVSRETWTGSVI